MSLPQRPKGFRPGSLPITLDEIFGQIRMKGFNAAGTATKWLLENDGTMRSQSILYHSGTTQIRQKAETDGSMISSLYGKASSTLTSLKVESTGELDLVLHGKDAGAAIDPFRTNTLQMLFAQLYRPRVQLDSVAVPSTDGILLDGSASLTSGGVYEVTFEIVNVDGTNAVSVDIWVDVGAGGTPAGSAEYVRRSMIVPAGGSSGEVRLTMAADDDIRGVAGAADDAAIRFIRVERVDASA